VAFPELTSARIPGGYDGARSHGFADLTGVTPTTPGTLVIESIFVPTL
jgi:hypothetical protein